MANCSKCSVVLNQRTIDPCLITEEQYLCQFINLFRIGPMWECMLGSCCLNNEDKSYFRHLVEAIGRSIFRLRKNICNQALETNPCTAVCQDTLEQWAEIYGISDCVGDDTGIELTSDLICKFAQNRGKFDCEWIKCLAEIEGYEVVSCETDCSSYEETTVVNCGTGFGYFTPASGTVLEEYNDECERRFSSFPCVNCCEEIIEITQSELIEQSCSEIQRILGTCSTCRRCQNKAFFPGQGIETTQRKLCNPSTMIVTLAGPPPCPTPVEFGKSLNRYFFDFDFKLCLLESQVPAHLNIIFKFEEEC